VAAPPPLPPLGTATYGTPVRCALKGTPVWAPAPADAGGGSDFGGGSDRSAGRAAAPARPRPRPPPAAGRCPASLCRVPSFFICTTHKIAVSITAACGCQGMTLHTSCAISDQTRSCTHLARDAHAVAARNSELAVSVGGEPALCFFRHLQQADTNRKQSQEVIAFLSLRDFWTLSARSASQVSGWPCSP